VAAAVVVGVLAFTGPAPSGTPVLLVARDLPPGEVVEPADVTLAARPAADVPEGALTRADEAVGRVLTSAARSGEVLPDVRVLGPSLLDRLGAGQVAVPVRIADAAVTALVRPGDTVDVVVAGDTGARLVADAATVLALPQSDDGSGLLGGTGGGAGGLVVLAVSRGDAVALPGAAAQGPLSLSLRAT
jgi:Flp pilus assembly protein CpaB